MDSPFIAVGLVCLLIQKKEPSKLKRKKGEPWERPRLSQQLHVSELEETTTQDAEEETNQQAKQASKLDSNRHAPDSRIASGQGYSFLLLHYKFQAGLLWLSFWLGFSPDQPLHRSSDILPVIFAASLRSIPAPYRTTGHSLVYPATRPAPCHPSGRPSAPPPDSSLQPYTPPRRLPKVTDQLNGFR